MRWNSSKVQRTWPVVAVCWDQKIQRYQCCVSHQSRHQPPRRPAPLIIFWLPITWLRPDWSRPGIFLSVAQRHQHAGYSAAAAQHTDYSRARIITASKPPWVKAPPLSQSNNQRRGEVFLENDMNIILMDDPEHNKVTNNHCLSEGRSEFDTFLGLICMANLHDFWFLSLDLCKCIRVPQQIDPLQYKVVSPFQISVLSTALMVVWITN